MYRNLLLVSLVLMAAAGDWRTYRSGLSCEAVLSIAKHHTRSELEALAKAYGLTEAQKKQALECLNRSADQK